MKLATSIAIWLAALLVAGLLVYRMVRRRPIVVRGRVSRRAIRIAAVVMVALGIGVASVDAQHQPAQNKQAPAPDKPVNNNANAAEPAGPRPEPLRLTERRQADAEPANADQQFLRDYAQHLSTNADPGEAARFTHGILYYEWAHFHKPRNELDGWNEGIAKTYRESPGLVAVIIDALRQTRDPQHQPPPGYSAQDIADALDEVFTPERLHPRLNAYLWGKLMALPAPKTELEAEAFALALYGVHRNARTIHAIIRAERDTGVNGLFGTLATPQPRGWMSKAGPSQREREQMERFRQMTLAEAKKLAAVVRKYRDDEDAGAWDSDGLVLLRLAEDSSAVQVVRPDSMAWMGAALDTRLTRLDLIRTGPDGGRLVSDWLGEITLPANATLRMIDLPNLLTDAQRERVQQLIDQTKTNAKKAWDVRDRAWNSPDDRAARESAEAGTLLLERHLPLVYPQLREAVNAPPIGSAWIGHAKTHKGAEPFFFPGDPIFTAPEGTYALRLITQLYDESVFLSPNGIVEPYGYAPKPMRFDTEDERERPVRPGGFDRLDGF